MTIQQILTFLSAKGLLHEDEGVTIAGHIDPSYAAASSHLKGRDRRGEGHSVIETFYAV
mgnify:CR=1 FL=1